MDARASPSRQPPLIKQNRHGHNDPGGTSSGLAPGARRMSLQMNTTALDAASRLSSTPSSPAFHHTQSPLSRRTSHQGNLPSPSAEGANTPLKSPAVRRASSSLLVRTSSSPSPGPRRHSSRSSLGSRDDIGDRSSTPKRSISNVLSDLREAQAKMEPIEEPKPLTATDIATVHFARELQAHANEDCNAEVVVLLNDACYGHRFARPKTTKSHLSMIVERPERLNAAVLGSAAAYVRLGEHHADGRNAPHPAVQNAARAPFKIKKVSRELDVMSPHVTNIHGAAWMTELRNMCNAAEARLAAGEKELARGTSSKEAEKQTLHEGDLYLCPESLAAFQGALGGVVEAIDDVFTSHSKRAFVGIRPPGHHCSADHPSGFCWLNNVHVGIEYAAAMHGLTHAVILDFDLHHGDGSQDITWRQNQKNEEKRGDPKKFTKQRLVPDVGYYSLHDINSYPCEDGDIAKVQAASLCIEGAHGQSVWNVHLEPWKTEAEFWNLYASKYRVLFDKARMFLRRQTQRIISEGKVQPRSAVFISAGFDANEWESAGMQRHKVNVPVEFYARFTRDCVELSEEPGSGCDGRVVSVLEGGYSDRALCSGVLSHLCGLCTGSVKNDDSAADSIENAMNGLSLSGLPGFKVLNQGSYENSWWSDANLTALETQVLPPPLLPTGKKQRVGAQPTYATPTESFAYKVRDTDKFARSISGTMREAPAYTRPKTPPPPEVDWVVATQELHRLLIPHDRQIKSHVAEDLAPVRIKKERQSAAPVVNIEQGPTKPGGRQLRERAGKAPVQSQIKASVRTAESVASDDSNPQQRDGKRIVSSSDRRQTVHGWTPSKPGLDDVPQQRKSSRRSSVASSYGGGLQEDIPPVPALPTPAAEVLQVKKARVPARAPLPARKLADGPAPASAPVSPLRPRDKTASQPFDETHHQSSGQVAGFHTGSQEPKENGIESLTSGLKKITLKVGSREESEKKAKEKLDAERKTRALKAAETRKRNAEAKKVAAAAAAATTPATMAGTVPSSHSTQLVIPKTNTSSLAPTPSTAESITPSDVGSTLPEWARLATNRLAQANTQEEQSARMAVDSSPLGPMPSGSLPETPLSSAADGIRNPDGSLIGVASTSSYVGASASPQPSNLPHHRDALPASHVLASHSIGELPDMHAAVGAVELAASTVPGSNTTMATMDPYMRPLPLPLHQQTAHQVPTDNTTKDRYLPSDGTGIPKLPQSQSSNIPNNRDHATQLPNFSSTSFIPFAQPPFDAQYSTTDGSPFANEVPVYSPHVPAPFPTAVPMYGTAVPPSFEHKALEPEVIIAPSAQPGNQQYMAETKPELDANGTQQQQQQHQ